MDAGFIDDSAVEISMVDGRIIFKQIAAPGRSLEELLAGVTRNNIHNETDTGEAAGSKAW